MLALAVLSKSSHLATLCLPAEFPPPPVSANSDPRLPKNQSVSFYTPPPTGGYSSPGKLTRPPQVCCTRGWLSVTFALSALCARFAQSMAGERHPLSEGSKPALSAGPALQVAVEDPLVPRHNSQQSFPGYR